MKGILRLCSCCCLLIGMLIPNLLLAQWTNLGKQSLPFQMTSDYLGIRVSHHPPAIPNAGPNWKVRHTNDDWVTEQIGYVGGGGTMGCCPVEAIQFLNDSVGFVQYMNFGLQHIAVTRDRGINLGELQPNGSFQLMPSNDASLFALNDSTLYAVGQDFALRGTIAYRILPSHNDTIFYDTTLVGEGSRILFLDDQVGFVIASDHQGVCRLYRTTNGGSNWSQRLAVGVGPLRAIDFVDGNTGFVAGASGTFYKTTDAGFTWNSLAVNGPVDVYALDFADVQTGYLGATGGLVMRTTDGGNLWSSNVLDSNMTVVYVKAISSTIAYAMGNDSVLYKRDYVAGANDETLAPSAISIYPNPTGDVAHIVLPAAAQLRAWRLLDLQGHLRLQGSGLEVGMQDLPAGLYMLEILGRNGLTRVKVVRR